MIPQSRNWKVTFYKTDGKVLSHVVHCVKRFAIGLAQDEIGFHAYESTKITVGLVK
jgi:hypothetical protein